MIDVRVALLSAFFALIGSFLGSSAVLLLSPDFLRILLVVLIPLVAVLTLTNRSLGRENHSHRQTRQRKYWLAALAALLLGFYDGFFGPGMGMFLILFFTLALKYDFVTANANTKVVNLASNIAAVVTFIVHGKVIYRHRHPGRGGRHRRQPARRQAGHQARQLDDPARLHLHPAAVVRQDPL